MIRRNVSIHLTPYAPGVGEAAIGERVRWLTQWSVTPTQAIADLAQRLEVATHSLEARFEPKAGDIEILGYSKRAAGRVLLALVEHGLTLEEIVAAIAALGHGRRGAA